VGFRAADNERGGGRALRSSAVGGRRVAAVSGPCSCSWLWLRFG
jgi:hypothetical protein